MEGAFHTHPLCSPAGAGGRNAWRQGWGGRPLVKKCVALLTMRFWVRSVGETNLGLLFQVRDYEGAFFSGRNNMITVSPFCTGD